MISESEKMHLQFCISLDLDDYIYIQKYADESLMRSYFQVSTHYQKPLLLIMSSNNWLSILLGVQKSIMSGEWSISLLRRQSNNTEPKCSQLELTLWLESTVRRGMYSKPFEREKCGEQQIFFIRGHKDTHFVAATTGPER